MKKTAEHDSFAVSRLPDSVCQGASNMTHPVISTEDASYRKRISVLDTNIAYVDVGEGTRLSPYTAIQPLLIFGEILSLTCCPWDVASLLCEIS
jgi:hypothetical protein